MARSESAASAAGTLDIGGDLQGPNRLGFGAMRITGQGIWVSHQISTLPRRCCVERSSWV